MPSAAAAGYFALVMSCANCVIGVGFPWIPTMVVTSSFKRWRFWLNVRAAGVGGGRLRIVEVRLHDDFLLREIRDQHAQSMGETLDVVEFDHSRGVAEDVFFVHGLEDVAFRPLFRWVQRKPVGLQHPRPRP